MTEFAERSVGGRGDIDQRRPSRNRVPALERLGASLVPALLALALAGPASGLGRDDVLEMNLEDLGSLTVEVTSVSKKAQNLASAAAAIAVITQEEIRRSGATSIPEALRLVPGVQVSQIDGNRFVVTTRGFSTEFADKLLVLMDGRSLYTPFFGGVYWDSQDTLLADIDRIEVIRGPGGTIWGANAVNGVINIITRHSSKTHGAHVEVAGGNEMYLDGGFRWGGQVKDGLHYRGYAKYKIWDEQEAFPGGGDNNDGWRQGRGGFRMDWQIDPDRDLTFQGDYYNGTTNLDSTETIINEPLVPFPPGPSPLGFVSTTKDGEEEHEGGNLLARYSMNLSDESNVTIQTYWDHTIRRAERLEQVHHTFDLDAQHTFSPIEGVGVVWGTTYRFVSSDMPTTTFNTRIVPPERDDHLVTGFVQADWKVLPDLLTLTAGSKFEHNNYTGFEWQPSVRASITPAEMHTLWIAGSRAVHTPTIVDDGLRLSPTVIPAFFPGGGLNAVLIMGRKAAMQLFPILGDLGEQESEVLYAVEGGYRLTWDERKLNFDIAGYWNHYHGVRDTVDLAPLAAATIGEIYNVLPTILVNNVRGYVAGFEALANWSPHERVRLSAYYAHIQFMLERCTLTCADFATYRRASPEHQFHVRAAVDLPWNVQLDTLVWYTSPIEVGEDEHLVRWDLRVGYRPLEWLDLSFLVQNVLEDNHNEMTAALGTGGQVPRTYFGKATIDF